LFSSFDAAFDWVFDIGLGLEELRVHGVASVLKGGVLLESLIDSCTLARSAPVAE